MTPTPTSRGMELTPDEREEFLQTLTEAGRTAVQAHEQAAHVRGLAFEMLALLESIAARDHVMEREFGQSFAARVRRVVKAAKGE